MYCMGRIREHVSYLYPCKALLRLLLIAPEKRKKKLKLDICTFVFVFGPAQLPAPKINFRRVKICRINSINLVFIPCFILWLQLSRFGNQNVFVFHFFFCSNKCFFSTSLLFILTQSTYISNKSGFIFSLWIAETRRKQNGITLYFVSIFFFYFHSLWKV